MSCREYEGDDVDYEDNEDDNDGIGDDDNDDNDDDNDDDDGDDDDDDDDNDDGDNNNICITITMSVRAVQNHKEREDIIQFPHNAIAESIWLYMIGASISLPSCSSDLSMPLLLLSLVDH